MLKILYTNADSLTNKMDELKALVQENDYDVICITETQPKYKTARQDPYEPQLMGYSGHFANKGRGVAIYTKSDIGTDTLDIPINFCDHIWLKLYLRNGKRMVMGCIYRSPNSSDENNQMLLEVMELASMLEKDHMIIVGDFNCKEIEWANYTVHASPQHFASKLFDKTNDLFLDQLVLEPTRHRTGEQANVLDLVLTDSPDLVDNLTIEAPLGEKGDHNVIEFKFNTPVPKPSSIDKLCWYRGDFTSITERLKEINWTNRFNTKDCNDSWETFLSIITDLIIKHIPKLKDKKPNRNLWVNKQTKMAIREKKAAWNRYRKNKSAENWETFSKARNNANRTIKDNKAQFEMKIANEIKTNPKQFWRYINSQKPHTQEFPTIVDTNGKEHKDDISKAETFNEYFASVYTSEDPNNIPTPEINVRVNNITALDTIDITSDKVKKYLQAINPSKAAGPDEIHPRLIYEIRNEILEPLTTIYKMSVNEGKLPAKWKHANLKPIFKKGNRSSPSNYRPVSLTAVCGKILERLIRDDIVNHLEENKLLAEEQHGFRKGRSCITQLLEIMEIWTDLIDQNIPFDTIYLDFSKAFDKVPHNRLCKKIEALGITGKTLKWIKHFLKDRTQCVKINNTTSENKPVTSGIPQGSVLGPVLFIIYINDIPNAVSSNIRIFADDTKIFRAMKSIDDYNQLQLDLTHLIEWSQTWLLPFNITKCKILHYGRNNPLHEYTMNDNPLANDIYEKDLGITFDDGLRFSQHIRQMVAKANGRVGMLKRNFTSINKSIFLPIYKALIRPLLEYGTCIWSPRLIGDMNEIEKVQRRATKLVKGITSLTYTQRLIFLNLDSLKFRRRRYDMLQTFRILKGLDNIDPNIFFEMHSGQITRGHSLKLAKPRANGSLRLHFFSNRIINDWNKLSESTVSVNTINSFKTALKNEWKDHEDRFTA